MKISLLQFNLLVLTSIPAAVAFSPNVFNPNNNNHLNLNVNHNAANNRDVNTNTELFSSAFSSFDQEEQEWEAMYQSLQEFQQAHGHCRVHSNRPLAEWLSTQQRRYQFDVLSAARVDRLKAITGVHGLETTTTTTSINPEEQEWQRMMKSLQQFQQDHGHCSVPKQYEPDQALADWVSQQHRVHQLDMMASERIERLKTVGLIVDVEQRRVGILDVLENKWEEKFAELLAFQQEYGHCNVPAGYDASLAEWVQYQKRWEGLNEWEDRRERLDDIGFDF